MTWIPDGLTLNGNTVDLLPLVPKHFEELKSLATDKRIWEFSPIDSSDAATFSKVFDSALAAKEKGSQYPFVIYHKGEKRLIGSTRFLDIDAENRKLEIGSTWLAPAYWATEINPECKLLLLTCCFETLKTVRVQFKTDATNLRSQKAIQKVGGKFEGMLRNERIRQNGTLRHSMVYSIIDSEWEEAKAKIEKLYRGLAARSSSQP